MKPTYIDIDISIGIDLSIDIGRAIVPLLLNIKTYHNYKL